MSLNKTKSNPELGKKVNEWLISKHVETPTIQTTTTPKEKIEIIEKKFGDIMNIMGLDLSDDSLTETPLRVAKMFITEIFWGLDYDNFPKCTTVENKMGVDSFVIERDIQVRSQCEHHLMPIAGNAVVAYLPKDRVLGLSKMNRIVEFFSRRPQIQERLTMQIAYTMQYILGTEDVAVIIDANHFCVSHRGVEDGCSDTVTSFMGGIFRSEQKSKEELFALIGYNKK